MDKKVSTVKACPSKAIEIVEDICSNMNENEFTSVNDSKKIANSDVVLGAKHPKINNLDQELDAKPKLDFKLRIGGSRKINSEPSEIPLERGCQMIVFGK